MEEYDVFISCKSEDYSLAIEIYNFLKENDVNPFLASEELRRTGEAEYMDSITRAIATATHCIVFASKAEYVTSKWVKFEWRLYLSLKLHRKKMNGNLMTILQNVSIDELPPELIMFESFGYEEYKNRLLKYVETPQVLLRRQNLADDIHNASQDSKSQLVEEKAKTGGSYFSDKNSKSSTSIGLLKNLFNWRVYNVSPNMNVHNKHGHKFLNVFSQVFASSKNHYVFIVACVIFFFVPFICIFVYKTNKSKVFNVNGIEFKVIKVPSGSFILGAKNELFKDETPQTEVQMKSFYIGETEVTKDLWYAVMNNDSAKNIKKTDRHFPICNVNYSEICLFIDLLNKKLQSQTGSYIFRLPTEIEWEYAAKGGMKDDDYMYSGSDNYNDVGWCENNSSSKVHRVSCKEPNRLGLYDMSGNVWECCSNAYFDYSNMQSFVLVQDVDTIMSCIRRGGSWKDAENCLRTTFRSQHLLKDRKNNVGFRIVLSK